MLIISKDIPESVDPDIEPTVAEKLCHDLTSSHQASTSSKKHHYFFFKWESEYQWLEFDEDFLR